MPKKRKKPITVEEAGRKGGKARAAKHPREKLQEWARKGGRPRKPKKGENT